MQAREEIRYRLFEHKEEILIEGAVRGYTRFFVDALEEAGLVVLEDSQYFSKHILSGGIETDTAMVRGLLKWIGGGCQSICFTRYPAVVRVAVYLKSIGYLVSNKPEEYSLFELIHESRYCLDGTF